MAKSRDIDEAIKRVGQSDRDKLYIKKGDKFKKREKELIQEYKTLQEEKRKTGPVPLTKQQERFVDFYVSKYGENQQLNVQSMLDTMKLELTLELLNY